MDGVNRPPRSRLQQSLLPSYPRLPFFLMSLDLDCHSPSRECDRHYWSPLSDSRKSLEDHVWRNKVRNLSRQSEYGRPGCGRCCCWSETVDTLVRWFSRLGDWHVARFFRCRNHIFSRSVCYSLSWLRIWLRVPLRRLLPSHMVQVHHWSSLLATMESLFGRGTFPAVY